MRYVGRITDWNDEKGFGFVAPNGGGDRAFVHIKAFERVSRRPVSGQLISYELATNDCATSQGLPGIQVSRQYFDQRSRASTRAAWLRKIIGAVFLILLLLAWLFSKIPLAVPLVYAGTSLFAFILYGADKSAALNNRWRTPESTARHVPLALLGRRSPGALIAQDAFRQQVAWREVPDHLLDNGCAQLRSAYMAGGERQRGCNRSSNFWTLSLRPRV